jgi:hypothetical protein
MNSLTKKVRFLIDQRYARRMRDGKSFNPLLEPSLFALYIFSVVGRVFTTSSSASRPGLPRRSRLMRFLGHSFYPGKNSNGELSVDVRVSKQTSFQDIANPQVTILVIGGDSSNNLHHLLESIKASSSEIAVEVMLLASYERTKDGVPIFPEIPGVRVWNASDYGSEVQALNHAIAHSRGEYFTVIDSSIALGPKWLEKMVSGISGDETISMVSGKVNSEDGLLEAAGNFVDSELQLRGYGMSDLPYRPKYNFSRETECSAGSNVLVRKTDFQRVGGFDTSLSSISQAFCKLSIACRKSLGKKVVYTPQAEVFRLAPREVKAFNVRGFLDTADDSTTPRPSGDDRNARILLPPKSVLFIDIGLPEHDRDSGSLRAFYLLKILMELGYHVLMVPRKGKVSSPYFEELTSLGVEVLYAFPDRKGMRKELTSLLPSVDIAWICRPQLNSEFEWIFGVNPKIKWIFDTIDLHYVRLRREAELFNSKKLMKKSDRFKKLELALASKADLTFTVTEDEKNLLQEQGIKNVAVIPNIHETSPLSFHPGFAEREGLLFIGSYHHPPNVDAVRWLVEEIMPIVWEKIQIPLTLLGNAPTEEVQSLESDLVKVPGYVQDVSPYFDSHRLFVAPLRYGAGMKGKIGQSLAYKLPIVTTSIGAEGVGLTHGIDVLIAEDKESFAQQIILAYQDEQLWRSLAEHSEDVLRKYSPEQVKENLAGLLERLQ